MSIEAGMTIGEYEMESALMNAGGLVKSVEDVRLMAATAVGAVLAGSYTIEPRAGNSPNGEVVYYHDSLTGGTYNALGMPNKGLVDVAANLNEMIDIAHDHGKPFILNFAPVTSDPRAEVMLLAEILADAKVETLDAIELNASCPNVITEDGSRKELLSHHPGLLGEVLHELSDIGVTRVPFETLMVRISPFRRQADAVGLAQVVRDTFTNVVSAFNTFPGGVPLDATGRQILQVPGGAGGRSGAAMTCIAEEQTIWLANARDTIGGDFDIVGSNGVVDGASMKRRLELGASAVSATTAFWEARSWGEAANTILQEYAALI